MASDAVADLRTSNATITFRGSLAAGHHAFRTSNRPLELVLPADAAFEIEATTSGGGRVCSDFEIDGDVGEETAQGSVAGGGGARIAAQTSNADLALQIGG